MPIIQPWPALMNRPWRGRPLASRLRAHYQALPSYILAERPARPSCRAAAGSPCRPSKLSPKIVSEGGECPACVGNEPSFRKGTAPPPPKPKNYIHMLARTFWAEQGEPSIGIRDGPPALVLPNCPHLPTSVCKSTWNLCGRNMTRAMWVECTGLCQTRTMGPGYKRAALSGCKGCLKVNLKHDQRFTDTGSFRTALDQVLQLTIPWPP